MKYILTDNYGKEKEENDISVLNDFLNQPFEYWQEGTGDSSISIKKDEMIIFFKVESGVFLMQHPDYLAPLIDNENDGEITHYVGGQEMIIPKKFIISDVETSFKILKRYINEGLFSNKYEWKDIYEEEIK
ncbi:hypothetical protein P8625_11160 [Tenacibaculum tangerinum]|uniref:Uncharacterized protein n=1 Tax=Tenacibaculum tangerinum TaxID=3038772 RepID=A0ABY8L032_9FLAO|nr:hypothetical protein [Tenacibaculum tangerinum]WGH74644.1 hypothetical protein P8625_11160 [Tenacibaculum tangerinum]